MMTERALNDNLSRRDWLLLTGFCFLLFGIALISDRPLSIHEAVLPQTARTMFADGDLAIPKLGDGPWLESPPLPQWITVAVATVFGRCDTLWIVRLTPVLMGTLIVLLVAGMATRWFGRKIGLLSGLIMATTCQLTRYAWLAEDEIVLCAVVTAAIAIFVRLEFPATSTIRRDRRGFLHSYFGGRSKLVLAFFVALGMTNLAKGLLFGTVMTLVPIAAFLLWNADWRRIQRYIWFWGWLAFVVIGLAWPVTAYLRYNDVLELWNYDLGGRLSGNYVAINEPIWYYPVNMLWILLPWTVVIPLGMMATRLAAIQQKYSPERFLWCWALLVPAVFSIPGGKHHHYMLHALAPWAVIASFGVLRVRDWVLSWPPRLRNPYMSLLTTAAPAMIALWLLREKIPGPESITWIIIALCPFIAVGLGWSLPHRNPRIASVGLFGSLLVAYCFGHWYAGSFVDRHRTEVAFVRQVRKIVSPEEPLIVNTNDNAHRAFLCLFYLDNNTLTVPNLTFLRDDRIKSNRVLLLTRYGNRNALDNVGRWQVVAQSDKAPREHSIDDRLTLFRIEYRDSTRLSSRGMQITPMQAINRAEGPFLGSAWK